MFAKRFERFADEFFVRVWTVDFSGIKKRHGAIDRGADQRNHLLLILRRAVRKTHAHTPESDRRNFQRIALPKCMRLHIKRSQLNAIPSLSLVTAERPRRAALRGHSPLVTS